MTTNRRWRVFDRPPQSIPGARSQRDLGVALLRAKRPREAIDQSGVAAQKIEETAEGYVYLVDALTASGNTDEAARQRLLYREFVLREWSVCGS